MSENTTNPRVYLTETMTEAEAGVLRKWLADKATSSETRPVTVNITDKTLAELAARTDDPMLAPLRVVWIPDTHTKHNVAVRLRDALAPRRVGIDFDRGSCRRQVSRHGKVHSLKTFRDLHPVRDDPPA